MGFGIFRLNTQCLAEEIDSLTKITLGRHDPTQMVVCLHKVRINLQSLLIVAYCLLEMTLLG